MAKLNHLPFEDWLFSDTPLPSDESRSLQDHLRACEECREREVSWARVDRLFRTAPGTAPTPGFTARWQERLAAQRLQRQRRQSWVLFLVTGSMALAILILLGSQIIALFNSPTQMLLIRAYLISILLMLGKTANQIASAVPLAGLIFFAGFASLLCVLWLVAYQQLTSTTRRISI